MRLHSCFNAGTGIALLACGFTITYASTARAQGQITENVYWNNSLRGEVFEIRSTVPQVLDCYIQWNGIRTGIVGRNWCSDGACGQGGGETVTGTVHLQVPAYRGGAPIVGSSYITGVGNVSAGQALCNPVGGQASHSVPRRPSPANRTTHIMRPTKCGPNYCQSE